MRTMSIGSHFPRFSKKAVVALNVDAPGKEFADLSNEAHTAKDKWMVMFWWPKDFTFVCPTEIAAFNKAFNDFENRDTLLVGASTDSEYVHLAWCRENEELSDLRFPLLADTSKSLAADLGILEAEEQVAYRATFIVDPSGTIRWVSLYDLNVGRNVEEVLRVLDALRSHELSPCNGQKGDATLDGIIREPFN